MTVVRIGVIGAGGRMGVANIQAIANMDGAVLAAAVERPGSPLLGKDASAHAGLEPSGVVFTDDIDAVLAMVDVLVDFTIPHSTLELLEKTTAKKIAHVIGTTGFTPEQEQILRDAAHKGARIVKSGNMSLGVNLLAALVTKAAATLGVEFDIEVLEMHHRHKVDAPSGTALLLGEAAAEGRKISLNENSVRVRDGFTGPREEGSIGFATLRGGSVIGEHEVIFAGPSERITLSHSAQDRSLFANGAIRAAVWIADKEAGFYSMTDVLGLNA